MIRKMIWELLTQQPSTEGAAFAAVHMKKNSKCSCRAVPKRQL